MNIPNEIDLTDLLNKFRVEYPEPGGSVDACVNLLESLHNVLAKHGFSDPDKVLSSTVQAQMLACALSSGVANQVVLLIGHMPGGPYVRTDDTPEYLVRLKHRRHTVTQRGSASNAHELLGRVSNHELFAPPA